MFLSRNRSSSQVHQGLPWLMLLLGCVTDSSNSITMQRNFSDDFILDIPDDAEESLFINNNNL